MNKLLNMMYSNFDNEWLFIFEWFGDLFINLNDSLKVFFLLYDGYGRDIFI